MVVYITLAAFGGLLVGALLGFFFRQIFLRQAFLSRDEIVQQAERDAENLRKSQELEGKEKLLKLREDLEAEISTERSALRDEERKLDKRESMLSDTQDDMRKREKMLESTQTQLQARQQKLTAREADVERILQEEQDRLYSITQLSADEAKEMLLSRLRDQLSAEVGGIMLQHENHLNDERERMAREIVGMAVQRYAGAQVSEMTVSSVDIPNDEMKGRIIGREGRNIRAFEKETGVDVIVDDTPGVVIVSAFDAVRREIAKLSLVKLIQDGRIHPSRIEEVVAETTEEIQQHIRRLGQEATQEAGVLGLHEKLIDLMGRLSFRTSYSQNVLRHSIEVAHLTGMLAEQLGLDGTLARRCGFLHDLGKAADHEMEGGHPAVGAELLKRYNEGPEVVHAAGGHHDDIRVEYIYTVLVAAADAMSAARPGARRETLERYVRRLEELEELCVGFPGVSQAYAVQAGREVRVIVDSGQVGDREATKISRDIAEAIEKSLTYPGEIKVTVLRETRSVSTAK